MRVLRDDPTKSSMHNREGISPREFWKSLCDFDHIPLYLLGLTTYVAAGTVGAYFTLILRSLGYSTFLTTMLQIPHYILFMLNNVALSYFSKKVKERTFVASLAAWWQFIFLIVLIAIPDSTSKWAKYAILTLFLAYPYCHPSKSSRSHSLTRRDCSRLTRVRARLPAAPVTQFSSAGTRPTLDRSVPAVCRHHYTT